MRIGKYIVKPEGFRFISPAIYIEVDRRFLWFKWKGLKRVFEGSKSYPVLCVEVMLPDAMERWFKDAIDQYERYEMAWAGWKEKQP